MTRLFSHESAADRAERRLADRRRKVHVVNADAFLWLDPSTDVFDFVVVDFPDPTNYSLGKLYTTAFYRLLAQHLSEHGDCSSCRARRRCSRANRSGASTRRSSRPGYETYPVSCLRAVVRRVGLRAGGAHAYEPPATLPPDLRFLAARACRRCSTSRPTWPVSRCRAEPPERSGPGADATSASGARSAR